MPEQTRTVRVVLETDRYRIAGDLSLPSEGYRSRFSDVLNREGLNFMALVNAEIVPFDGGESEVLPFVAVARNQIRIAYEA